MRWLLAGLFAAIAAVAPTLAGQLHELLFEYLALIAAALAAGAGPLLGCFQKKSWPYAIEMQLHTARIGGVTAG
jgi:hypothetical protein